MVLFQVGLFWLAVFTFCHRLNSATEAVLYPGLAKSERDLQSCGEHEVCSIVHKRFLYPMSIERLCRCADKECPSTWADMPDNYTMHVNNRAQMKFCEPVVDLPNCMDTNETTARYLTITNTTVDVPLDNESAENIEDYKITSTATCYCPPHHMWMCSSLETNISTQTIIMHYRCAPLDKCKTGDFCGSERSDYYSVYYHCSCPVGHFCVRHNYSLYQAREIFYDGPAIRAYCTDFPEFRKPSS